MFQRARAQFQACATVAAANEAGGAIPSMEKTVKSRGIGESVPNLTLRRDLASLASSASVSTGTCA